MSHTFAAALASAVLILVSSGPRASAADLPASTTKGLELLKQGDGLADKKETAEAVLRYKQAFEQILPVMRGVGFRHEVKRDVTAREDLQKVLIQEFEEEMTPEELLAAELGWKVFGLIPDSMDLKATMVKLYAEEIAAFYDPRTKTMHLIKETETPTKKAGLLEMLLGGGGGFSKEENKTVIAHELTHALADQNFDLTKLQEAAKGDDDRSLAVSSLIEGEATMTMMGASMQDWDGKLIVELPADDLDQTFSLMMPFLSIAGGKSLRSAPAILTESMIFPYLRGMIFCTKLANSGGWKAVDAAYRNPPLSTEQILHPEKYLAATLDRPTHIELGDLDPGSEWVERGRNVMGEMQTAILLKRENGKAASAGWDGDRFAVFQHRDRTKDLALVWATTWDSEDDAREFLRAYLRYQTGKMEKGTPNPGAFPDSNRRPQGGEIFAVEKRGRDVVVVEGFASEVTERLIESAFRAKKTEMTPEWLAAEAESKAKAKAKAEK
ncbi:MAG: hypothetical protein SFX72_18575 [Isosphaeraceae bacterium]|nr:hypothetical protein [Isosphaeraceae bacterium]